MYDTGKTTSLNKIGEWLVKIKGYNIIGSDEEATFQPNNKMKYDDLWLVLEKNGKKIILHSATDDKDKIDELHNSIMSNPDTDIVITSCRDIHFPREYFDDIIKPLAITFYLESPVAKITRRDSNYTLAESWYINNLLLLNQYVLESNPYNC